MKRFLCLVLSLIMVLGVCTAMATEYPLVDDKAEFRLTISPKKRSGGLFALLEEGFFDHELGRRINTNNEELARKVVADPTLRAALLACPDKNIEVTPGPEGVHMARIYVINPEGLRSTWPVCAIDNDYESGIKNADEIRQLFFPPFERLLNVTYAVCGAVERAHFA